MRVHTHAIYQVTGLQTELEILQNEISRIKEKIEGVNSKKR